MDIHSPRETRVQISSATKEEQCWPCLSPWDVPSQGPLTIIQWHLPLWGNSTGFQVAIVPGKRRDEACVVDGAHRPLLFILWEVWPRQEQNVRECSAHQHLSLEETPKASIVKIQEQQTAEQSHLTQALSPTPHNEFRPLGSFLIYNLALVHLEGSPGRKRDTEAVTPRLGLAQPRASLSNYCWCRHFPSHLVLGASQREKSQALQTLSLTSLSAVGFLSSLRSYSEQGC